MSGALSGIVSGIGQVLQKVFLKKKLRDELSSSFCWSFFQPTFEGLCWSPEWVHSLLSSIVQFACQSTRRGAPWGRLILVSFCTNIPHCSNDFVELCLWRQDLFGCDPQRGIAGSVQCPMVTLATGLSIPMCTWPLVGCNKRRVISDCLWPSWFQQDKTTKRTWLAASTEKATLVLPVFIRLISVKPWLLLVVPLRISSQQMRFICFKIGVFVSDALLLNIVVLSALWHLCLVGTLVHASPLCPYISLEHLQITRISWSK